MDVHKQLAPEVLLPKHPRELHSYLRGLDAPAATDRNEAITIRLLGLVHSGAIPPLIFEIWLPNAVQSSPHILKLALLDPISRDVRRIAVNALIQALRTEKSRADVWEALGGSDGLVEIFNAVGVQTAAYLAKKLRKCRLSRDRVIAKDIDRVVQSLIPTLQMPPGQDNSTPTNRSMGPPLVKELLPLIQSCSEEFITWCLSQPSLPQNFSAADLLPRLTSSHLGLLRKIALGTVQVRTEVREELLKSRIPDFISSYVPYESQFEIAVGSSKVPPGMRFFIDLLHSVNGNNISDVKLPKHDILKYAGEVLDKAEQKKVDFSYILSYVKLVLSRCQVDTKKAWDLFPAKLVRLWAIAVCSEGPSPTDISPSAENRFFSHLSHPKSEHIDVLQDMVVGIVKKIPAQEITSANLDKFIDKKFKLSFNTRLLRAAQLPLIKILTLNLRGIQVDLDSPSATKKDWRGLTWDVGLLAQLPAADARWLFERTASVDPSKGLITGHRAGYLGLNSHGDDLDWLNEGALRVRWEAEEGSNDYAETYKLLGTVKQRAERNRDAEERSAWAARAVNIAVLSHSIDVLEHVITWSSRFLRDPLVDKKLSQLLCSSSHAKVLSCVVYQSNQRPKSLASYATLVNQANSILSHHIDTAVRRLREPSVPLNHYRGVGSLIVKVFMTRMKKLRALERLNLGSDTHLADMLIGSLISILLKFEGIGMAQGNEELGWAHLEGPLHLYTYDSDVPNSASPYLMRLIDDYVRKRDELWTQWRVGRGSSMVVLGKGWPKGLPVQYLLPYVEWTTWALKNPEAFPYMTARVKDIVYAERETCLVSIPDETSPIGQFIDSLTYALSAYALHGSQAEQCAAILRVWTHYSQVLSEDTECLGGFKAWITQIADNHGLRKVVSILRPPPRLPCLPLPETSTSIDSGPVEWDVLPDFQEAPTTKKQPVANENILQCRVSIEAPRAHYTNVSDSFARIKPWPKTVRPTRGTIWTTTDDVQRLPAQIKDALVVSAILFINTTLAGSIKLLSTPFPDNVSPRYPALYLGYQFLSTTEKERNAVQAATGALEDLVSIVPASLLRDLASSLLTTLTTLSDKAPLYGITSSTAFRVMSLLSLSDQPQLVVDLGLKVVAEMPDDSSWHRRVLSIRLGRTLDSRNAQDMVEKFASFVVDSLEKQKTANDTPEKESPPPKQKVRIKITTIKMVAELIEGGFVSLRAGSDILRSLFVNSSHIDVRTVAIHALFGLLRKAGDLKSECGREIYDNLVSFAMEVSELPNERVATSEKQWIEAEAGGLPPPISRERPLADLFLSGMSAMVPANRHADYVQDVVLPFLDKSTKQHNRWMKIFLSGLELSLEQSAITDFGPFVSSRDVEYMVFTSWKKYIPKSYLSTYHRAFALRYFRGGKLHGIEDKLTSRNPRWKNSEAGQYWRQYIESQSSCRPFWQINTELSSGTKPAIQDGITNEDLMDEFCARVAILIREPFVNGKDGLQISASVLNLALSALPRQTSSNHSAKQLESEGRRRSVFKRIIADIESLRTPAWQKDPARSPKILPSHLHLQALLLPFPDTDHLSPDRHDVFVSALDDLIKKCAASPSCQADFTYIIDAVRSLAEADRVPCVLAMGGIPAEEHDSVIGCLKIQVAHVVLDRMDAKERKRSQELNDLIESWKESPSEWVRLNAWKYRELLDK
ncbi:hypothetical protein FQN50_000125 [Emmonsiellopsis sp. PD_5]|nr:hypothetical protein FQN50_000125 [Emmonsiellopsis sp. PD_5]